MPWAGLEFSKDNFAEDGNAIAPIERNGTDVENSGDSCVGSESDQINGNAPEYRDPDGVERRSTPPVDDRPDPGSRDEPVARERKECPREGLLYAH